MMPFSVANLVISADAYWVPRSLLIRFRFNTDRSFAGNPLVELRGLEPLTPCLQSRCATNCATAP